MSLSPICMWLEAGDELDSFTYAPGSERPSVRYDFGGSKIAWFAHYRYEGDTSPILFRSSQELAFLEGIT